MSGKAFRKNSRKINYQDLINSFLFTPPATKVDWAREMKLAVSLSKEHGLEFLYSLRDKKKMPSLAWFKTDSGIKFIQSAKALKKLNLEKEEIKLEDTPVAPEVKIDKKPKTVQQFLNIFNKK